MKKRFLYLAVLCLVCSLLLSACSLPFPLPFLNKDGADIASDTDTTVAVQNTVNMMDLEGVYSEQLAHRGTLRLTAKDSQTAAITIDWPGSATESAHWEMTGTYDPQKQAIVYNDAVMMEQTKSETGAQSNRLVSSSGTGRFTISGKNLAWTDDLAYIGSDPSTFTYSMSLGDDMNQSGSSLVMGTPSVSTVPVVNTPAVPVAAATPTPSAQVPATPAPSVAPTPAPTPAGPAPGSPVITKDPTDEKVQVGGSCWFVANHRGANFARWHFVSPDGTDIAIDTKDENGNNVLAKQFPNLNIHNGEYDSMKLSNIPAELNGYRFYCHFWNANGSVDSKSALLTVEGAGNVTAANPDATAAAANAANGPKVTKDPTDETVKPGESAWFVAKHTGAILARWHFVSPDGSDYEYTNEAVSTQFPQMKIVGGDQGTMQLQNIPLNANGWKVYCRYSNNSGTADTKMATITVQGATQAAADNTVSAAPAAAASTVVVNDWTAAADLNAAISISGVSFSAPGGAALPGGTSSNPSFRAKTGTLEANFSDANSLIIRKSTVNSGNDLSGDYTNYSGNWPIQVGALTVNCRGDGTTVNAATYDLPDGGHVSISYNMGKEGSGLTSDQVIALVDGIQ